MSQMIYIRRILFTKAILNFGFGRNFKKSLYKPYLMKLQTTEPLNNIFI